MHTGLRLAALVTLSCVLPAQEPEPPKRPWSDTAAMNFVVANGNAASQSLGFSNEYTYTWPRATFACRVGGIRVATTRVHRSAYGTSLSTAKVQEVRTTQTSTETYFANLRYDRTMNEHFQWFCAAGWERNVPSGLEARHTATAGLGYWWLKEGPTRFFTDAGAGYTEEDLVFRIAGIPTSFAMLRLAAKLERDLRTGSLYTSELIVSDSIKDLSNYLVTWRNVLTVNLSSRFALKVAYDVTYKNKPASVGVNVIQTPVTSPPVFLGKVPFRLKRTDTVFTTSLVVKF